MFYVCVRGVMDVVFSICIVTYGTAGARVREVYLEEYYTLDPVS